MNNPLRLALSTGLCLAALAAAPRAARAYDVTKCRADNYPDDSKLTRTAGTLSNATASAIVVVCPIVRTTSGPGVSDDKFVSAKIPITTSGAEVSCDVTVWRASASTAQDTNIVQRWGGKSSSTNTPVTIAPTAAKPSPKQFWDAAYLSDSWYYMDLHCSLGAGAALKDYTITEGGTTKKGYFIYPAYTTCAQDPSNNLAFQYGWAAPGTDLVGGYLQGQANGGTKFAADCPVPTNSVVEMAFGRPNNSAYWIGCNLDNNNLSSMYWAVGTTANNAYPTYIPREPEYHVLSTPLTGTHQLVCGVNSGGGDGRILSYRVMPPWTSRSGWSATAKVGGDTGNAFDGKDTTRWTTTNTKGTSGMWYLLNMGAARVVQQVTFDSGADPSDYARGYLIEGSSDGKSFWPIATGTGTGPFISSRFAEEWIQYVRITLTSSFDKWWSIRELYVY